jgi:hypothetical protein
MVPIMAFLLSCVCRRRQSRSRRRLE